MKMVYKCHVTSSLQIKYAYNTVVVLLLLNNI